MAFQLVKHERRAVVLLIALGFAMRLAWLVARGELGTGEGEAFNVAISLVRNGVFGDPFGIGTGPTAHLSPSMSLITAAVYWLLGIRSTAAELLLAVIAIGMVLGAAALFYHAWRRAGFGFAGGLAGLAMFCLLPLNLKLETVDFRAWDGGLAILLMAACLFLLVTAAQRDQLSTAHFIPLAGLGALALFINPGVGLGVYAGIGWLALNRLPLARWPATIALGLTALALVIGPWAIRNQARFGEPILLRSNAGLEFALANHAEAVTTSDPLRTFEERFRRLHPHVMEDATARAALKDGETAYARRLGGEAMAWARAHPGDFVTLSLSHLRQIYFPPAWHWALWTESTHASKGTYLKMAICWALGVFGLAGAVAALLVWKGPAIYVALLALVPSLPYIFVQPTLRYRYLLLLPLMFLAAELLVRLGARMFHHRGSSGMLATAPSTAE
jgi:hypothetical protein